MTKPAGRPGARKSLKKGAVKGSGGQGRKALEGKGPTPKAEDRAWHFSYFFDKLFNFKKLFIFQSLYCI